MDFRHAIGALALVVAGCTTSSAAPSADAGAQDSSSSGAGYCAGQPCGVTCCSGNEAPGTCANNANTFCNGAGACVLFDAGVTPASYCGDAATQTSTCPAVDGLNALAASLNANPGACSRDSDCVVQLVRLECDGGGSYELCGLPVNQATADDARAQMASLDRSYCGCNVGGSAQCRPFTAKCVDGTCSAAYNSTGACTTSADCPASTGTACVACSDGTNPCGYACISGSCVEQGCPDASAAIARVGNSCTSVAPLPTGTNECGATAVSFHVDAPTWWYSAGVVHDWLSLRCAGGESIDLPFGNFTTGADCRDCSIAFLSSGSTESGAVPDGGLTRMWDGTFFGQGTCPGATTACIAPACLPAGSYEAQFCLCPPDPSGGNPGLGCTPVCQTVPFTWPRSTAVTATFPPVDAGAASADASASD